jgi:hypothetical protein
LTSFKLLDATFYMSLLSCGLSFSCVVLFLILKNSITKMIGLLSSISRSHAQLATENGQVEIRRVLEKIASNHQEDKSSQLNSVVSAENKLSIIKKLIDTSLTIQAGNPRIKNPQ